MAKLGIVRGCTPEAKNKVLAYKDNRKKEHCKKSSCKTCNSQIAKNAVNEVTGKKDG